MTSKTKIITVVSAVVVLAAAIAVYLAPEKSDFKSSALFARDPFSKDSHVDVDAHVDRNLVSAGDNVLLEVNVHNSNPEQITEFHLSLSAPGFAWDRSRLGDIPSSIPADSSATAVIPLTSLANSGSYNMVLFYCWNKKSRYSSALSIGPLKMEGMLSKDHWSRFLGRSSRLIKDLTLPIVLAILGYFLQRRQASRDSERHQEEKTRDERQQVRQNILPLVMNLAERHYMPIVRASRFLIIHYNSYKDGTGGSSKMVFFDTLFLLKRMDYLRRDKGQIFFQDDSAETIAGDAWFVLREKLFSVLGDSQVGLALQKIGNDDGFAEFTQKRYEYLLADAFKRFEVWLAKEPDELMRYLRLVDLIQCIFRFEANRPFSEHWYNTKKGLNVETDFLTNPDFPQGAVSASAKSRIAAIDRAWPLYYQAATKLKATQFHA